MPSKITKRAREARAQLASASARAHRQPDDEALAAEVEERRRDYRFVSAEDYVRHLVEQAPPLTDTQRRRLASLLATGADDVA